MKKILLNIQIAYWTLAIVMLVLKNQEYAEDVARVVWSAVTGWVAN